MVKSLPTMQIKRKSIKYGWTSTKAGTEGNFLSFCPHGSFNYFYGAFLLGILWANHSGVCGSQSLLVYLRILPHVCMLLLAKMDFTEKVSG